MSDEAPAQGYCRLHGVHRGVCRCRVASVDPDALGGREKPVQAIQILSDAILGHMRHIVTANEHLLAEVDSAPETACRATGRCTHQSHNPIQHTYEGSRADA